MAAYPVFWARRGPILPLVSGGDRDGGGADFRDAIRAAAEAAPVLPDTAPQRTAGPSAGEAGPAQLYHTATGRTVAEAPAELPPYCNDQTLASCLGGGIDTARAINWQSKGDKELTAEQIAELKKKYDVNDLTRQEYYDLMADLTGMGVLAGTDCAKAHLATAPPPGRYFCPAGSTPFGIRRCRAFRGGSLADYYSDAVDELMDYLSELRRLNPQLPEDSFDWLEQDIAPRQRMAELLEQLR